jgi:hypothetical protein
VVITCSQGREEMIAARMLADAGERAKRPCRYWDEHFRFRDKSGPSVSLRAVGPGLMSGGFPDACVLIEHFIRDAVKHDRTVIQPFQVVNLVCTLFRDCARR